MKQKPGSLPMGSSRSRSQSFCKTAQSTVFHAYRRHWTNAVIASLPVFVSMGHGQEAERQIGPFIETYCVSILMNFLVLCKRKYKWLAAVSNFLEMMRARTTSASSISSVAARWRFGAINESLMECSHFCNQSLTHPLPYNRTLWPAEHPDSPQCKIFVCVCFFSTDT